MPSSDAAIKLFKQIVQPAMVDCDSLSLPDYRIIQGAVMQAIYAAQRQNAADVDCPHTYRTGVGKWMICNECGERV